jgi:hypothetical protein
VWHRRAGGGGGGGSNFADSGSAPTREIGQLALGAERETETVQKEVCACGEEGGRGEDTDGLLCGFFAEAERENEGGGGEVGAGTRRGYKVGRVRPRRGHMAEE